jgi:hypothetical protein
MQITVVTISGACYPIDVEPNNTIDFIKESVFQHVGIHPLQQRILYQGRILFDVVTVEGAHIEAGAILHLVTTPEGGI